MAQSGILARPAASKGGVVVRRGLLDRLEQAARVTLVSASAGSGKTLLVRSWVLDAGIADNVAWVSAVRRERDPQQFWVSVIDRLRSTAGGSSAVRPLTPAPGLDSWSILERLLEDLDSVEDRVWLVVDDLQELERSDVLRQLELLLMRAPDALRFVLLTRHDLRLGLHRLRLDGGLTEIRAADLRFTVEDTRALFEGAGINLSEATLGRLVARTEGWAAGLRLAALSMAGRPDPERFAKEFSGSERTVAEYLLAEVLDHQAANVRRLLLRTAILEQVSGSLADLLTGDSGGERILQDLEDANAFVTSVDAQRVWFRYHRLFRDLLQLELRRCGAAEIPGLHRLAADWFTEHGYPIEAIRHAQAAGDWARAARLLSDVCFRLGLAGQAAVRQELLAGFPPGMVASDAELAGVAAADELNQGSIEAAERDLAVATELADSVDPDRRERFQLMLGIVRLQLGRQRNDLPSVIAEAERQLAPVETAAAAAWGTGEERRVLALVSLGIAELWTAKLEDAERHLDQGIQLARRIDQPYLELTGLAHSAMISNFRDFNLGAARSQEAIALARRHGWSDEPVAGVAYTVQAGALTVLGRLDEAEPCFLRAQATLRPDLQPAPGLLLHYAHGVLELARGRAAEALADFRAGERLSELLVMPHALDVRLAGQAMQAQIQLGETDQVEEAFQQLEPFKQDSAPARAAMAALRLAQGDPAGASALLAPVLYAPDSVLSPAWALTQASLLEARARDELGDPDGAFRALEHALDLSEPQGALVPFLLNPMPALLQRHARRRTAHASLISDILSLLSGAGAAPSRASDAGLREPLSESEVRVLRYLPTNLSQREIAEELYISAHTVKTHIKHLYAKLGAHGRAEAVESARALGLLAPSARRR